METRIPTSERTSQKLNQLLTHGVADGDARAELLKRAVRKIVEEALEAEVSEAFGRLLRERRRGWSRVSQWLSRGRLRTAEGAIEYGVPQVADCAEPFLSRVRGGLPGVRPSSSSSPSRCTPNGLSTRNIEAAFRDARSGTSC